MMKLHPMNLSGYRLTPVMFALAAALALPPAFAQTSPAPATPPDTAGAPATPMHEGTSPPESEVAPAPTTPTAALTSTATFKELDANKDGKLSKDEVASDPMWSANFDTADTDKDGYISKSEFKKYQAEQKKTAKVEDTQR